MGAAAQSNFLVKIHGVTTGYFPRCSGAHIKVERTKSWDGGQRKPETLAGFPTIDDLHTGRDFDPSRDEPVLRQLRPVVGRYRTTVSVQPTDPDLSPLESPRVYPNALLVELNEVEADAASGTPARFEFVWSVDTVA
jgi:hypothetical protein